MSIKQMAKGMLLLLVILMLINYQIVTIIFNDSAGLKYLRDVCLVILAAIVLSARKIKRKKQIGLFAAAMFVFTLVIATQKTSSMSISITFLRRYLFPIAILLIILEMRNFCEMDFIKYIRSLLKILFVFSLWGIFQAWVLGDRFLIRLGYPIKEYFGTLRDSYYFGGLGIQRVVSTLSNSNVFALILGITILTVVLNSKMILCSRKYHIFFIAICAAYLLTFSRANFLAMIIVGVVFSWKYIPGRMRKIIIFSLLAFIVVFSIGVVIRNPLANKVFGWIIASLTGNESSSANRFSIWSTAGDLVIHNPLGIGFGHVGAYAQTTGVSDFVHSENSFLAIAIDTGWFGLTFYLLIIASIIRFFKHYRSNYARTGLSIVLYMLICFMFSNHIYDMEATTYIFILIAMCLLLTKQRYTRKNYEVFSCSV